MKKILVTGASGFVGLSLTKSLLKNGYSVQVLIRNKALATYFKSLGAKVIVGNFTNPTFQKAMKNVTYIYHLAAEREVGQNWKTYYRANVIATQNLLKEAIKNRVKRFIYLSTVHVHGFPRNLPVDEKTQYDPRTSYAKSKMLAELEVIKNRTKIDFTIVRSTLVYGPGDKKQFILKFSRLFNPFFGLILGNGKNRIHFIYINDLTKGLLLMLKKEARNEIFILSGKQPIIADELATMLCGLRQIRPFVMKVPLTIAKFGLIGKATIDIITHDRYYSTQKAQTTLGFKPRVEYFNGLRNTLDWAKND